MNLSVVTIYSFNTVDHSRVQLTLTTAKNDSDYINANFIKGVSGSRAYIATQGPLPQTVRDFLRMIWEYNIKIVVMACREFEMGKKKCERYWPEIQEQPFICEPFKVYCDSEEAKGDYLTRTLRMSCHNSSRTLTQLHYINWPDHGVPDSIPPILDMLHEMRLEQAHDDIPVCIHCSAGCGRTGALCVIDYTWNLLKKQMIPPDFSIYNLVQNMRTQRPSLVQTKEQYELVYRTIKLLFEKYLQSMDEVAMVPRTITPETESDLSDLSEDLDLVQQIQQFLDEERASLRQNHTPSSCTSDSLISANTPDTQRWTLPDSLATTEELKTQVTPTCQTVDESENVPPLNPAPSPAVAAAICQMVEDPYFDLPSPEEAPVGPKTDAKHCTDSTILSTPTLFLNDHTLEPSPAASGVVEVQADGEEPPPLPQRTPESYILANDAERADSCERLTVIIPPNAAAEAVRNLGGSPPSPAPPLPERTPESFLLATDEAPVEQKLQVKPAVDLSRIGVSSEWSGNSTQTTLALQNETKPWLRSKSLRAKMTLSTPAPHFQPASNPTSFHQYRPPPDPTPPSLLDQTEESLTPPLPDRTPEAFVFNMRDSVHETMPLNPQHLETTHPSLRVSVSSDHDTTSQPKRFLDAVKNRSKSVRVRGSKQEPLTAAQPLTPPAVVRAEAGSAQVEQHDSHHRASLSAETSENSAEKSMYRSKSFKFFRQKLKPKTAPPPPPTQPGAPSPPYSAPSFSLFKFGFGNRFGKPKGPRTYPDTWV
ncbi:tyrosine-protein phosphatase non-receptor type 22 isoform X1 [Xyrichtys novacula]|uniref:protein-tyrosine-phosphatase n=1 Tax=Xyrichtys novacula TaxID=13765 RepID=A0AAV1HGP4_XYRNO|nr:tyrosine-protein phosphatase non-receptor type 22 isoform X1 [Xyrichtys novacula]